VNAVMHTRSFCNGMRKASACVIVIGAAALFALAAPASAAVSHVYSASYGAAGSSPVNPYPLSGPFDVDVDQTSHDLYVVDTGNRRIEKFDSAGNFVLMFGKGVDQTTGGNVCPASPGDVCQAGSSSSTAGGFITPKYIAVDNDPTSPSEGDVYVADPGAELVQKFDSSGHIVSSWGVGGQKDGTDNDLGGWTVVGGPLFGVAVGGPHGTLYVGGNQGSSDNVFRYTQDGTYIPPYDNVGGAPWLKADLAGDVYYQTSFGFGTPTIWQEHQKANAPPFTYDGNFRVGTVGPLTGFGVDPSSLEFYQDTGSQIAHYSDCDPPVSPCDPADEFGGGHLFGSKGVAVDGENHTVYVANSTGNEISVFSDARPIVTTGPPTNVTEDSVTLNAHVDPAGRGNITSCRFEYGFNTSYGSTVPCTPDPAGSNFSEPTDVTATITGLSPGTKDHYRVVVSNTVGGTSLGADRTFITTQAPAIDGLSSAHLTATSADLNAQVNPNGLDTTYHFDYGTSPSYGQSAPVPDGVISASNSDQPIGVHLEDLQPHVVYHYHLVATNDDGTTTSGDQTFNFYPPSCPNENVRQQDQANYIPDCRAYELVSPGDAAGTQLYPGGPNTGRATSPSRFSFTGQWGTIPNSGGDPINSLGDLYVATRTASGWVSRYVGPPANEVAIAGGPPQGLPNSGNTTESRQSMSNGGSTPDIIQNNVLTNPQMSTFLDWNDGNQAAGAGYGADSENLTPIASNAPYVWSADGEFLDRWPTNLATVPAGQYPPGVDFYSHVSVNPGDQPLSEAPGGLGALNCPTVGAFFDPPNFCPGDVTASADLSHFVFASGWNVFAAGGQLTPPGSVYDNATQAQTVTVASRTPGGANIPSEPNDASGDPLEIPDVSSDGSHILMASGGVGPCGLSNCPIPPCSFTVAFRCPMQPSHLYMRVNGAVTYDVSKGYDVKYLGATEDASKVYFTSPQQLTPDDTDSSTDLYMWSEATDSLTRVSAGSGGEGNSDACNANFTSSCGVVTYTNFDYCALESGIGGNCRSDNSVAAESGDVYFFSPELLDGSRGIPNQENLYDFHNGTVQYVATLTTGSFCVTSETYGGACSAGPVVRMQVNPSDSHMAFITASPVTQYDNAGHLEMYTYEPSTRKVVCVSCVPSGAQPTSDVEGSQDGLFLTDDGRAFFSTDDALVSGDTNNGEDVYEYVSGRPQLITPGTGETQQSGSLYQFNVPGLVGVSADGTDAYFSTYNTLVSEDHNGLFLKFYDARAGGGFPAPAPPPPCAAADECHGIGSSPPAPLQNGSGAPLGKGGNAASKRSRHRRKKHHRRSPRHHRHARNHSKRHVGSNRRARS
jgi:hypothetical protein